jgi:hypothetical protein
MALNLEPHGQGFLLTQSDTGVSMAISDDDILSLAQSLPALRDRVLARYSPKGGSVSAVAMTPVTRIVLNTDAHNTEIHLTLVDRHGARLRFALDADIAGLLAERLPVLVAEIDTVSKGRARQ